MPTGIVLKMTKVNTLIKHLLNQVQNIYLQKQKKSNKNVCFSTVTSLTVHDMEDFLDIHLCSIIESHLPCRNSYNPSMFCKLAIIIIVLPEVLESVSSWVCLYLGTCFSFLPITSSLERSSLVSFGISDVRGAVAIHIGLGYYQLG